MDNLYWLALSEAGYLSNKEKYNLANHFNGADKLFKSSYKEVMSTNIIRHHKIDALLNTRIDSDKEKRLFEKGIRICSLKDKKYPQRLMSIYAPPVLLYYLGELPEKPCVAVVGSRKSSQEGRDKAFEVSKKLAAKGICIISGMARGIDSCAHLGALENGLTAAVLGSGLNICYPAENKYLMERIEGSGCVISEYPPDKRPSRYTFPSRNRIISGMSEAVIVVEAALKSGALITADFALEQGREVLAFKNESGEYCKGTEQLLNEGAIPINNINDFISTYT